MCKKSKSLIFSLIVILAFNFCGICSLAAETEVTQLECQVYEKEYIDNSLARATTFIDTSIGISYSSSGMFITIDTIMNKTASVVGVKDIQVQIQNGDDWVTVATSTGGELTNTGSCCVELNYTGAIVGQTYRVTCIHYANVDGYRELYHETAGV